MAKKGSVVNVAVCGLTTSSFSVSSGSGAGKSYLCNRFVRSKHDELKDHTSRLNNSDFGSNIVNQDHFLYWGGKTVGLEDGQDVTFQIVEHTEFMDDSTFKPFSFSKPYHKRCSQLKLHSGGKVMYISDVQLALPEEYTNVPKFPDKFNVDGFILCVDVSIPFDSSNPQKDFLNRLFPTLLQSKKPVVVALTKFDYSVEATVAGVTEIVSKAKKQVPLVEVSALKNVNVDVCFLVLCHLVDPKKPKTRQPTYQDARAVLEDRIRRIEESFQGLLNKTVNDIAQTEFQISKLLHNEAEHQLLLELKGSERTRKLIRGQLAYLKKQRIQTKFVRFIEVLPLTLESLLPELSLNDNIESCCQMLRASEKFDKHFVDVMDWRDDLSVLKSEEKAVVPWGMVREEKGLEVLQNHIDKVLRSAREDIAFDKIQDILSNSQGIYPGTEAGVLWSELGLEADAELVHHDRLTKLYLDHMSQVERECVTELKELLLERIALFEGGQEDSQAIVDRVHCELEECPRYKRLDKRPDVRKGQVLKYIGSVQVGSTQERSHVTEALEQISKQVNMLSLEALRPPTGTRRGSGDLLWNLYTDPNEYFTMALMARTLDNALTMRSDFMNHLSGSGIFEIDGEIYRVDMSLFHDNIQVMTNEEFIPDGAIAVVDTMECLDWLEDCLTRLWLPRDHTHQPSYRGMPLVILALDRNAVEGSDELTPLHRRAKALARLVQAPCLTERPTDQPKRLVLSSLVLQVFNALLNIALPVAQFFSFPLPVKQHQGLNIAVCTVTDDPYSPLDLVIPWLSHQATCLDKTTLLVRSSCDQQLRTATLTFHSALNVREILSFPRLGFVMVYTASRLASFSAIKFLCSKLPSIPKLIVAMSDKSCDNQLIDLGREFAEAIGAGFISTGDPDWTAGWSDEFFAKCWNVRFTSWNSQTMPDDVVSKQREKRRARALPDRPLPQHASRHSIAALLDDSNSSPPLNTATLPRPAVKDTHRDLLPHRKPASLPSPPQVEDLYSDPIQTRIGIKQMKAATLDRKKSSTSSELFSPTHILSGDLPDTPFSQPEGDYASVEDALQYSSEKMSHQSFVSTLERQRRGFRSPSMSPPPVPLSPTDTEISVLNGGSDSEAEDGDMYATVNTSRRISKPSTHGYDRLEKSPEVQRKGYDHLNPNGSSRAPAGSRAPPPAIPPRTSSLSEQPIETMYATVDTSKKKNRLQHSRHKSADGIVDVEAMYTAVKKPPVTRPKPPRANTPDEPVYSMPDKRFKGRNTPPFGNKTPPPIAPKPPRRSPTPTNGGRAPVLAKLKAGSFDMAMKPPLLQGEARVWRSSSFDRRGPVNSSPVVPLKNSVDFRTSSLPKNYRHGVNGHAPQLEEGDFPALPERHYNAAEIALDDEAPPLPPRVYNWSDFEDDDDQLFQSEDELDDHKWSVSDQQKLYATITQATQRSPSVSGVEAIYQVVNKMVIIEDDQQSVQVARQSTFTQEEESAYDTLENVLKTMREDRHTPYSPTTTPTFERGVASPEHVQSPLYAQPTAGNSPKQELKSTQLTPTDLKHLRKTQKLLKRLEKQAQKEAARRQASEAKKRKREEDEQRKREGKKKKKGKGKQPERTRYFGSSIEKVAGEGGIPVFVRKCVEFLEGEGLTMEGIYRVPGKKENVLLLQDRFEEDHNLDIKSLDFFESAVSSTLKAYFKLLPDPLIPERVAAQLLVVNSLDPDSQKTRIHELLLSLPRPNLKTLQFIMEHLHKVQEKSDINKMTPSNLSIVFWPTLLRPPLMDLADQAKQLGWQLIMTRMIERPDFVPSID